MLNWFSSNSAAISAIASVLTLLVWLFYAQLLYMNFKRQRQPKIIINRGFGSSMSARCVISNMSTEPIFVEHLIAVLHTDRGTVVRDLIDLEEAQQSQEDTRNLSEVTRQGPMLSGSYSHIGTFADVINRVMRFHGIAAEGARATDGRTLQALEIRVVAIYGSEDRPVGAARTFDLVDGNDAVTLIPTSLDTARYASFLKRRRVARWIRELDG